MADPLSPLDRIRALEALGPRRLAGTPTEKAAQASLGVDLEAAGFRLEWVPFRFSQSLYASLMLHFGLATLGTWAGLARPSSSNLDVTQLAASIDFAERLIVRLAKS